MKKVLVDTNVWIGLYNTADANHEKAKQLFEKLEMDSQLVINNQVFSEVVTVLSMRAGRKVAIKVGEGLLGSGQVDCVYFTESDAKAIWEIFCRVGDKDVSLVDCGLIYQAQKQDLTIVTFDRGLKRLQKEFGYQTI